jgi:hypothetical protein
MLNESGIYNNWLSFLQILNKSVNIKINEKYMIFQFNILRLKGVYYLLLIGIVFSIIILLLEKFNFHYQKNMKFYVNLL